MISAKVCLKDECCELKDKHIPLRKCIGCGIKNSKENFIMVVNPPKKENSPVYVDFGKNKKTGRSAYMCFDMECLKKARKTRRLERTFSCKIESRIYDDIEKAIQNHER